MKLPPADLHLKLLSIVQSSRSAFLIYTQRLQDCNSRCNRLAKCSLVNTRVSIH